MRADGVTTLILTANGHWTREKADDPRSQDSVAHLHAIAGPRSNSVRQFDWDVGIPGMRAAKDHLWKLIEDEGFIWWI
jgi:hypothetical protein